MNYQNLLKIALRAIAANKMRSFLTALGIIIGIAAVITMLAIGQGSKESIKANIAEMGSNMIMISPGADMRGGVRQDASSMETLKQADYQSIKEDCNYISAISPTVNSSGQWIYGNNNTQSSIYGVNQDYLSIRQLKVADGEMFTDTDKGSCQGLHPGSDRSGLSFSRRQRPDRQGSTFQQHPVPCSRCAPEEGLQLHGNGPG